MNNRPHQMLYYFAHTHARVLAEQGFFVLICDTQKKPNSTLAPRGYLSATNDIETISAWRVPNKSTVGIACKQSRLIVFDCDMRENINGVQAFHDVARERGIDLSQAPCVRTPSGGLHYYFRLPDGLSHGNGTGDLPEGVDVRCAGYVIAPDCCLPDGRSYKLVNGSLQNIPTLPDALQTLLARSERKAAPRIQRDVKLSFSAKAPVVLPTERETQYAQQALENETNTLAAATKGGRNNQLFKSAAALFNFVASGWLEHAAVESAMWHACAANGLIDNDGASAFYKTLHSAIAHGISTPRLPLENMNAESMDLIAKIETRIHWHGEVLPLRDELVKGMLPRVGVGLIAGQSGAGKTYMALELSSCVMTGLPFFGHKVCRKVGVLLLLAEGAGTIAERLEAVIKGKLFAELSVVPSILPIAWYSLNAPFYDKAEQGRVRQAIADANAKMQADHGIPLGLIIVDTLAAAFAVDDENAAGAATQIMQQLQSLAVAIDTLVLAVAHYGKDANAGLRGSTAYEASADVILAVIREKVGNKIKKRTIGLSKSRWRDIGWESDFTLKPILIGRDEEGDEIWSCYVEPTDMRTNTGGNTSSQKRQNTSVKILLLAFEQLLLLHGPHLFPSSDIPNLMAVRRDALRERFNETYPAEGDTEEKRADNKRKQFKRALDSAICDGLLLFETVKGEELIWKPI